MIVYHSSYCIVEQPDVCHSRECLDFGKGFYVTYSREQAIKYAERFLLRRKKAFLNVYELSDNFMSSSFKKFDDYNEEWLDFVANCRKGMYTEEYDIVMGGIANDKVFRTIDLYFAGDISRRSTETADVRTSQQSALFMQSVYNRPIFEISKC